MYYDLFARIPKGSILLWNVGDEKELPKRLLICRVHRSKSEPFWGSENRRLGHF